ncbi:hypothetical protein D3C86_1522330 [compost metagenome]
MAIVAAEAAVFLGQGQAQQAGVARVVPQLARHRRVGDPLLELFGRRVLVDPFADAVGEEGDLLVLHEVGFGRVEHVHGRVSWAIFSVYLVSRMGDRMCSCDCR